MSIAASSSDPVVRDLHLLRASDLQAIESTWRQAAIEWATHWGRPELAQSAWVVRPAEEHPDWAQSAWQAVPQSGHTAWFVEQPSWRGRLAATLIGRTGSAALPDRDWSLHAAQAATDDLLERLAQLCASASVVPGYVGAGAAGQPVDQFLPMSGAIVISNDRLDIKWLLAREACEPLLPTRQAGAPSPDLSSVLLGVESERMSLKLGLGEIEVALDDLLKLEAGDVVQFPAHLDDPLSLQGPAGAASALLCKIGRIGPRAAVQIQSLAPSEQATPSSV